jgi:hypothetical protein
MKKTIMAVVAMLCAGAMSVQASVLLGHTTEQDTATKTLSVTDLNNTPPTVSGDNSPYASGTFATAGSLDAGAGVTIGYSAATNWNAAAAQSAIAGGTFGTYLAGLDAGGVSSGADAYGVYAGSNTGDNRFQYTGEALFMEVAASGLTAEQSLVLEALSFSVYVVADRTDFLIYDASANAVVEQNWDVSYNDSDEVTGNWVLETGDVVILAAGVSGIQTGDGDGWRLLTMTMDIIPEPATFGLFAVAGGGLLCMRRRFRK